MKIEHFAFNAKDPTAIAARYCEHPGFSIKVKLERAQTPGGSPFSYANVASQ